MIRHFYYVLFELIELLLLLVEMLSLDSESSSDGVGVCGVHHFGQIVLSDIVQRVDSNSRLEH